MKYQADKYLEKIDMELEECRQRALEGRAVSRKYKAILERRKFIVQIVELLNYTLLSQRRIAERMGVQRSAVGRLIESIVNEKHSPTINTLRKFVGAMGKIVQIRLV
jgi:predicted XRE-type DNA-binding protein